ncbi:MAG: hypothetical protein ACD_20C00234G0009 [uncultured bacterium]|nr:MAG: hypothetical protein ACD_20C00234G0009 [uncultured bacterium]HBH18788.1 DNA polymerase III subunit gamma/tau [Cyanobacteria bacterium UBA9579]
MASSYIPLYRKYRPQKFKDIVGQESIVRTLSNALELNKVAHAYLLTGPRGTGKTSTARIFAKSLNCQNGPTLDPCGECPSCLDIARSNAIDVIEIDAASNRKVEDARNLLEKVQFVPVAGKYKIYIIDEVHMLTTEAFNTLLKTLEEPPPNLVFILATTEAHKVLNTIISRCQRFDFRRIRQDLIVERLKEIIKIENININDKALSLIARRSAGGLRDALSLLDQVSILASIQKEVTEKDILTLLGCLQEDTLYGLADAMANRNTSNLIAILDEVIQLGSEPIQILRELMNYFRNLLLVKTTDNIDEIITMIDVSEQFYGEIKKQSEQFEVLEITQIIDKLSNYEKTLRVTSQQHLWLEVALISIANRQDIQVIKELEARLIRLEEAVTCGNTATIKQPAKQQNTLENLRKPEPVKVPAPIPVAAAPVKEKIEQKPEPVVEIEQPAQANKPEIRIEDIKEEKVEDIKPVFDTVSDEAGHAGNLPQDWKLLLDNIEGIPSRMFFTNLAKPIEINSSKIVLAFANEGFAKQAQDKTKLPPLEKASQKLFGTMPKIITRTLLPGDEKVTAAAEKKTELADSTQTKTLKKENFEQITQEFDELPKPKIPKVVVSEEPAELIEDEIIEQISKVEKIAPVNLSDQAKMVLDLFQGKIIE